MRWTSPRIPTWRETIAPAHPMNEGEHVRDLQERAARALPASEVVMADGWWLRHAPGSAWWAGSVLPHHDAVSPDLLRRVVEAEEFYAGHGATARFQISPGTCPAGLDAVLAGRGYRCHSAMSLQVASTAPAARQAPAAAVRVRLDTRPAQAWLDLWHAVHGHGGDRRSEREMLDRVQPPSAYACATIGEAVVAVGRAVVDDGWAGVFGMATRPVARGRGAARSVLASLAQWADDRGAGRMYLQVERDNVAALALYRQAGFQEICTYHYRSSRGRP
jgi:GNAT superfamily N-acetyltransferase